MKKIVKYTFLTLLSGWLAIGCTSNFEEYNTDPYAPQEADPNMLLPTMVEALMYVQQNDSQMVDRWWVPWAATSPARTAGAA